MGFPKLPDWLWRKPSTVVEAKELPDGPVNQGEKPAPLPQALGSSSAPQGQRQMRRRQQRRQGCHSGNNRHSHCARLDSELDALVLLSDCPCSLSGSESDDSDWSVGWFEPHGTGFLSGGGGGQDDEDSFAVLVPCYGSSSAQAIGFRGAFQQDDPNSKAKMQIWVTPIASAAQPDSKQYIEQWLSSLKA